MGFVTWSFTILLFLILAVNGRPNKARIDPWTLFWKPHTCESAWTHSFDGMDCGISSPATVEHYKAAMLLSGVGDALGYKAGSWEFNFSGPEILKELKQLGGLKKIKANLPNWPLSDDTILHLATAEGLATGKEGEALLHEVAALYKKGMCDMSGRAPGGTTVNSVSHLKPGQEGGYRVPYSSRSGGCGAAMRAMCIGLRYPKPNSWKLWWQLPWRRAG
ncbi:hypothetical protein WMY93_010928 [Mugilogobius chulae]|uniref:ADP-ribosylarginine hydrolase n=1 Tax=Mugilogobius chulae TaxID=88201 RepID=A0AAW0PJ44_9GOBI